jgi:uncharacterized protein
MGIEELLADKRREILAITEPYGAANVRVFGSLVRGEANENSDVDFLIEPNPDWSLLDLIGYKQDLEALLGRRVDIVTEEGLHQRLKARVLREAVPL